MRTYRKVEDIEEPIAELMVRHADRFGEEVPRGIWVCENNGVPEVLLLAFTEGYLRLAFVVDDPDSVAPAALLRLGETFEAWAGEHGITRYALVVHESDDHYRKMIERLGAVETSRAGGWVHYVKIIAVDWVTNDGIRSWTPKDWVPLRPLVRAFLKQDCRAGGDLAPVKQNVEEFIRRGMQHAHRNEPFLLAQDDGRIIGFICVSGVAPGAWELRGRPAEASGLFVLPSERKNGWARKLYDAALRRAHDLGYDRVTGHVRTRGAQEFHQRLGFGAHGMFIQRELE